MENCIRLNQTAVAHAKVDRTSGCLRIWMLGLQVYVEIRVGHGQAWRPVASSDRSKTILKVNPLIRWTKKDVWTHIHKENCPIIPYMMRATCPWLQTLHARRRTQ